MLNFIHNHNYDSYGDKHFLTPEIGISVVKGTTTNEQHVIKILAKWQIVGWDNYTSRCPPYCIPYGVAVLGWDAK
jgi:hypothetical protein